MTHWDTRRKDSALKLLLKYLPLVQHESNLSQLATNATWEAHVHGAGGSKDKAGASAAGSSSKRQAPRPRPAGGRPAGGKRPAVPVPAVQSDDSELEDLDDD
jgi:hypothetical protein